MSELQNHIRKTITKGDSMLDIGCGPANFSKRPYGGLCGRILTLDAWAKVKPDIVADLEKESLIDIVKGERFDHIMMMDFIEHVEKDVGARLISEAQELCNKRIWMYTPLEVIWDDNSHNVEDPKMWSYGNEYDYHKSMWEVADFPEDQGWTRQIPIPRCENYFFGFWQAP